jgi:ferric-dicitrate binding protein FerR (iron transport regulator)
MNAQKRNEENRSAMCGRMSERMSERGMSAWLLAVAALALGAQALAPALRADDAAAPARAIRLSSVDGQVQLSSGSQVLADGAVANTPLFEGTRVVTSDDGRAEIQFEDGSVARLSPNSALTLTVLRGAGPNAQAEITLDGGLGYFELQNGPQSGAMSVRFGDSVATASGFTVLRVNLDNAPGELAVFSGNAHLERDGALAVDLHGGESVALSATDVTRYTLNESIEPDSWDSWNSDRDQVLTSESAAKTGAANNYAQSSNPAWNDLDANGNWYDVPGQGNIWSPYDASDPGWDPYGSGNWMNSPGYGYTWISANSWGYLPYSCGAWNWYDSFGWGWAPGMGGCSPWWGAGFYGGPNIGAGFGGYRPPIRPRAPRRLIGAGLIAVNRRPMPMTGALPPRDKTSVVRIAGYTVQPIHSLAPRQAYDHSASGFVNRTVVTNVGSVPASGQGRTAGPTFGVSRAGSSYASSGARSSSAPGGRSSVGSTRSASSGASASRASSGGGFSAGAAGGGAHAGGGGGGHH